MKAIPIAAALFLALWLAHGRAAAIAGPIRNPATGHDYYLLSYNTWTASESEAITLGGHLVTINDDAENQ